MSDAPSLRESPALRPTPLPAERRERPSRHGAILGAALAEMERLGRAEAPDAPPMCATCAFREGCMTNQMASTALVAFQCAMRADPSVFACHHGMIDGEPSRPCGGWLAALAAPFADVKRVADEMRRALDNATGRDLVREAFDAWIQTVDPDNSLNDYERGRLYLRAAQAGAFVSNRKDGSSPQSKGQSS